MQLYFKAIDEVIDYLKCSEPYLLLLTELTTKVEEEISLNEASSPVSPKMKRQEDQSQLIMELVNNKYLIEKFQKA